MLKITEVKVLKFMQQSNRGPFSLRRLMVALKVNSKERRELKNLLQNLVNSGQVILIKGGKYGLIRKMNLVSGYVKAHPSGYGFVIPDNENQTDIFLSPGKMKEVFDGDHVMARVDHVDRHDRRSGSIVRILKRAHKRVIGRYEKTKHISFVIPNNPFLTQDIIIPKGKGKGLKPKKGQLVTVDILEYPTKYRNPTGKIIEILGWPDDPNLDIEIVIRDYQLPDLFPEQVLKEAQSYSEATEDALKEYSDLRNLLTFTIDGEKAQDFDDALSLQLPHNGNMLLWVHIADVSYYVKEDSDLDKEAFLRATSVYFPDRAIHMLPEQLSHNLCSLNPGLDRLTISVGMEFDSKARLLNYKIIPGIINSNERMTYTQVRDILSPEVKTPPEYLYLQSVLEAMGNLAMQLRKNRLRNGSLDFDLPEPEVILDLRGDVQSIIRAERNLAHNLIEEFMLAANQVVAGHLGKLKIPSIYRIHEAPEEADLIDFLEFVHGLGWEKRSDKKLPKKKCGDPAPDKMSKQRLEHKDLQEIMEYFEGKPEKAVVNFLLLRSMKQARYSTQNVGHFGLAIEQYTHFTSPIRRYPDLIIHRLVKKMLNKTKDELLEDRDLAEKLALIANHSSLQERIAVEAERKIINMKRVRYMQKKITEEYTGIISGITAFGFFVELEKIFVEGLVHIRNLGDDYYQFDEQKHQLEGHHTKKKFHIGDRVKVRVAHVDLQKLFIDFTLLTKLESFLDE